MKHFLFLPLFLGLISGVNAHPNYKGAEIGKQYGFKINSPAIKKKLTNSEREALKALCKIALNAGDSGYWSSDDINAAIASIKWGEHWGDYASPTAYKTCNWGGYLD